MTWDPSTRACLGKANRPDMVHLNTEAEKCISSVLFQIELVSLMAIASASVCAFTVF